MLIQRTRISRRFATRNARFFAFLVARCARSSKCDKTPRRYLKDSAEAEHEEVLAFLKRKFGSLARAWYLGLDPDRVRREGPNCAGFLPKHAF